MYLNFPYRPLQPFIAPKCKKSGEHPPTLRYRHQGGGTALVGKPCYRQTIPVEVTAIHPSTGFFPNCDTEGHIFASENFSLYRLAEVSELNKD